MTMVRPARFNSIATRIAIAIILALILGIVLMIGLGDALNYSTMLDDKAATGGVRIVTGGTSVFVVDPRRNASIISSKVATIARLVDSVRPDEMAGLLAAVSGPMLKVSVGNRPILDQSTRDEGRRAFLQKLIEVLIAPKLRSVIVTYQQAGRVQNSSAAGTQSVTPPLLVEVRLSNGRWLMLLLLDYAPQIMSFQRLLIILLPQLLLIGLLSIWTARQIAAPIRKFAAAAESLGVDVGSEPLVERGPNELRAAIHAFNRMQERLRRFLEDRTRMLAAMSHDLRAPLARLRLRAEFIEEEEQQRKMFSDLDAMNAMIEETLIFARDNARQEPRELVDFGNLIEDICEDAADAGGLVEYSGARGIDISCRPSLIRRAITNVVENAVKYGNCARVRLNREQERVVLTVEDDGPGIPSYEQEKVFAPFYRIERSRDPHKGGVGLGLSVARTIAREHGGEVTLANRDEGGLSVRMELPA